MHLVPHKVFQIGGGRPHIKTGHRRNVNLNHQAEDKAINKNRNVTCTRVKAYSQTHQKQSHLDTNEAMLIYKFQDIQYHDTHVLIFAT